MTSGIGRPLRLRLFLEGQEVPVIAANVSIGVNQPAAASIQIIPVDAGMELKPRTMVHLFYLDSLSLLGDEIQAAKDLGIDPGEMNLRYKLLFSGEVVGFAFAQTPMSRSLVLQCLDFSSYWDACHATAIEYGPGGNAFHNMSSVYASNASLFDDIVNFQSEKLVSWLKSRPKTPGLQNVSGLAGGIISMLEAIGGVPTHFKGVNDFFTFAELRCRLLAQITAEESDDTARRLLSGKVFDEWLRNGLQNAGQQVTFRDMAKLLCRYIYYDFVPNPAAKYDRSIDGTSEKTTTTSNLNQNPVVVAVRAALEDININVTSALTFDTTAPANAIKNTANSSSDALGAENEKLKVIGSSAKDISAKISSAQITLQQLAFKIVNEGGQGDELTNSLKNALADIAGAIQKIDGNTTKVTTVTGVRSTSTTARLRTQIFRPDCFFVPAPRCNVIFPEHYTQVAFDRNYLSEVTRSLTMGYMTLIGRDALLADKVMAPNIGLDMAKIQKQAGASGYRILMPHERHTGIIPRSEWLPNTSVVHKTSGSDRDKLRGARLTWLNRAALFHFFKYRFGPRRISISGRFNPYLVCGFPGAVILKPFIPDAAKLREALKAKEGDTLDSTSKKVLDVVQSNGTGGVSLGAPFQLLGMIGSVTHSIDQTGGTTSVAMHHGRRHLGTDDEFVGVFSEQRETAKSRIKVPITADVAFSQKNSKDRDSLTKVLVGVTPQSGAKTTSSSTSKGQNNRSVSFVRYTVDPQSKKVISELLTKTVSQGKETTKKVQSDPVDPKGRIDGVDREVMIPKPPGSVTAGSQAVLNAKGKVLGVEVVDSTLVTVPSGTFKGKKVFRSVVIHEEIEVLVTDLAPVEEIIRPSWFSTSYANAKIGPKIYTPFFGTTSIIDDLKFTGLIPDSLTSVDDVEGTTYDPKKSFQEIQKAETDKQKLRTQLSIEKAINVISYFYGLVRTGGKDIDQFIREYTQRPIATMVDMLGTPDLNITYNAKGAPTITKGKPGFHSLALDWLAIDKGNLTGLLDDPDKQLPRINGTGKKEPISPVYDIRKEKLDMVDSYIDALRKGPGLRG